MNFIQGIIGLPLILSIDKSGNIKWYVGAEFVVHKYMKSRTEGFITMVTGGYHVQSSKQTLNTNSSSVANLVVVGDVLTQVIWTQYFPKEQGYKIRDNVIFQDNQSAIKLENWVILSSSKRIRRTNISHYCITDKLRSRRHLWSSFPLWTWSGIISLRYCRDLNFVISILLFLVSMNITFPPIIWGPSQYFPLDLTP